MGLFYECGFLLCGLAPEEEHNPRWACVHELDDPIGKRLPSALVSIGHSGWDGEVGELLPEDRYEDWAAARRLIESRK